MQKYILTLLLACICVYATAQNSGFSMGELPKSSADTIKPVKPFVESVPRTPINEVQATQPIRTTTTTTTPPRTGDYNEAYPEAIKTKEGYWVIGISPTFTEPPSGVQLRWHDYHDYSSRHLHPRHDYLHHYTHNYVHKCTCVYEQRSQFGQDISYPTQRNKKIQTRTTRKDV